MTSQLPDELQCENQTPEKENELRKSSSEENMSKFRELLMRENLDIVARLKKYKKTDFRRKIVLDQWKELKRLSELSKVWVSVPFIKQKFDGPVITIDSSKAGSNIDALRLAINDLGWKEYPNGCVNKSCHIVWNSCNYNDNRNNVGSFVNKHPGITSCLHKVAFSRTLETMRRLFPAEYRFYPLTWYLPHQLTEFTIYCHNREFSNKKEKYYIVKPDAGTQGEGIYLIRKPQDYRMSSKTYVVQEYLSNPLLLDGYKFDLRIYAVLMSLDPLKIYLCNEGLARFCTKQYIAPSADNLNISFMHLTNYSLNKKSNEFVHTQKLDSGSKRTVSSVFALLQSHGYKVGNIWKKLEELVYKTILAIVPQLKVHYVNEVLGKSDGLGSYHQSIGEKDRPSCFQILGFDILIMEDLQPFLLEVNSNPSMRLDCEMEIAPGICEYYVSKVDVKIKKPLVRDTLKLLHEDICKKFNLFNNENENKKIEENINKESKYHKTVVTLSRENSMSQEKENVSDICRKWSQDSDFGPHFLKIAEKNNILPKYFESPKSDSKLTEITAEKLNPKSDIQVTITGTSPLIRQQEEQKRRDELMSEKSWLSDESQENEMNKMDPIDESEDPQLEPNPIKKTERKSCLTLISTNAYQDLFEELRILEETTIIFSSALGHRYSDNMGATSFRMFGRQCKLYDLGFNHAMIDLIYIEVQRQWSFVNSADNKQGLCYQAFIEAFFRIAFTRYSDLPKHAAVKNLIQHCKTSMGAKTFNSVRNLYSTNNNYTDAKENPLSKNPKTQKILIPQNSNSIVPKFEVNSNSSESSFEGVVESSKGKLKEQLKIYQMESRQTKYDIMRAIHEIYRSKFPISRQPKPESYTDSESVKSQDEKSPFKTPKLPYIQRVDPNTSRSNKFHYSANLVDKPGSSRHGKTSHREFKHKSAKTPPKTPSDYYIGSKTSSKVDKAYITKILSETSWTESAKPHRIETRSSKNAPLAPVNTKERMQKLIAVYGADSQNYLKRSMDKISKRNAALKPI